MGFAQELERLERKQAGLIEAATCQLGPVERNRNHEELAGSVGRQPGDGLGEHLAEGSGRREEFVVFERMEGSAHWLFVEAVGDGADEGRRGHAADAAKSGG